MEPYNENKRSHKAALLMLVIAAVVIFVCGYFGLDKGESDSEIIKITTKPAIDSITIKWDQRDDVEYYEVFRKDITDVAGEDDLVVAREEFTRCDIVVGKAHKYRDEDVEMGHSYAYVIDGYRKSFGRIKHVCTSYQDEEVSYNTVGLAKPDLINFGYGESYENSKDKIYLFAYAYDGIEPTGADLYRKSSEGSEYEKIDYDLLYEGNFRDGAELLDNTVKPGKTYTYKIRTFTEEYGKMYFSADSEEITIPAVNFTGKYEVEAVTEAWDNVDEAAQDDTFVIKVTSKEYNGVTAFVRKPEALYVVQKGKNDETFAFNAKLVGYSNAYIGEETKWQRAPKDGAEIAAGDSIYLKYKLSNVSEDQFIGDASEESSGAELYYGGDTAKSSMLIMDGSDSGGAIYHGSGNGHSTNMSLNLVKGKGSAYEEWD